MAPLPRDREKLGRMEQAVRVLIHGLGEDLEREGLRDTPKRVAKALLDCTQGYHQDTSSTLGTALFHERIVHQGNEGMVLVRDIDFASTSEETLLPFHGRCHVAYRPKDGVVLGLSKLARLTKQYAKRFQTQERLAAEIAVALQQSLECNGVAVVLRARHLANSAAPEERTNACVSGVFAAKGSPELEELLSLLNMEDLPAASIHNLDNLPRASALGHMRGVARGADPGVTAPGTPDPSEKDTDGDSDDLLLESSCCCDEMESAVQQLLLELGENPHRPGLAGSGRRYVASLLVSTSGYHQQLQLPQQSPALLVPGQGTCEAGREVEGSCGREEGCVPSQGDGSRGAGRTAEDGVAVSGASCGASAGRPGLAGVATQGTARAVRVVGSCGSVPHCNGGPQRGSSCALGTAERPVEGCVGLSERNSATGGLDNCVSEEDGGHPRRNSSSGCCTSGACCARTGSMQHRSGIAAALDGGSGVSRLVRATGPLGGAVTMQLPFSSQCEHHMLPFYGKLMVSYFPARGAASDPVGLAASALPAAAIEQVVSMYTQRLQVQERITHQVADAVEAMLRVRMNATALEIPPPQCAPSCDAGASRDVREAADGTLRDAAPAAASGGTRAGELEGEGEGMDFCGGVMVVCDAAHMCMVARGVENHGGSTTSFAVRGAFAARPELRRAVLRLFREHSQVTQS